MNEPLSNDEINSELTGLNKGEKDKKKKLIITGVSLVTLTLISINFE